MNISTSDFPLVSVIVPVYNNSDALEQCLSALHSQTYPQESYEVIVVDNASDEDISRITSQFSNTNLTHENYPGSYAARNQGIAVAKGDLLAFTDSDCIPEKDWLEKGIDKLLEFDNCGLVAGKVELFFRNPDSPNAAEFYDAITFLDQHKNVKNNQFGATANMFTFAQRFQQVGLFNNQLKSSGDKEWGQRLAAQGFEVIYAQEAVVKHPARSSVEELRKKSVRVIGGLYDLQGNRVGNKQNNSDITKEFIQRLKPPVKYLRWRLSDRRLEGAHQKAFFILITVFLNYVIALELINLRIGRTAKRF